MYLLKGSIMPRGKIAGLYGDLGQVVYEGNAYNFVTTIVDGGVKNHQEVEFEFDEKFNIKVIYGNGAKKPAPTPKKKQKENTTSKLVDNRDLLTEEK